MWNDRIDEAHDEGIDPHRTFSLDFFHRARSDLYDLEALHGLSGLQAVWIRERNPDGQPPGAGARIGMVLHGMREALGDRFEVLRGLRARN